MSNQRIYVVTDRTGDGGIDGCRSHKEVRAIVLDLLRQIDRLKTHNARANLTDTAR